MASPRLSIVIVAAVCLCVTAWAVEPPLPVSPGSGERIERIASPCPTFSWAAEPGALGVRIAIYAIPADESAPAVLVTERELPGTASSWTPPLPDCLQPGTYAWGVGVLTSEGGPFWSEAAWFEVVAAGGALPGIPGEPGIAPRDGAVTPGTGTATPEAGSGVRGRVEPRTPSSDRLAYSYFSVGSSGAVKAGAVDATSFTGDGSGLTNLNAGQLTSGTVPSGRLSGTYGINVSGTAGNVTGLSQGDVTFGNASGNLAQDSNNFFWDDNQNRLGLGTSAPQQQLHLSGNLRLPQTTNTPIGVIYLGPTRFIHAYNPTPGGTGNAFLGYNAGNFGMGGGVGNGDSNTGIGTNALANNLLGSYNTAVGINSLLNNADSAENTALGAEALQLQSFNPGSRFTGANTAVGVGALRSNNPTSTSNGINNTAVGASSMYFNTTGYGNAALGRDSLRSNTTGTGNVAVGNEALLSNTSASGNTAVGHAALQAQSFDPGVYWTSDNTAVGDSALGANQPTSMSNGAENTAVGAAALMFNSIGHENTAVGSESLAGNTTAAGNTAIGKSALQMQSYNNAGAVWDSLNTAVGYKALEQNQPLTTVDAVHNTAVGAYAMQLNATGGYNAATGHMALGSNLTGYENTANGDLSMQNNTSGFYNTAIGAGSLMTNQTGASNTAVGNQALSNVSTNLSGNVALGFQAGQNETTSNKLHIANNFASSLIWGDFSTGQVIINNPTLGPGVGSLYVNGTLGASTLPLAAGQAICDIGGGVLGWCGASDARLKTDVTSLTDEIDLFDTLSRLRGVAFDWDRSNELMRSAPDRREIGMIAQEVEAVLPSLVTQNRDGYRSLDYAKLTAFLVEVAKAQQADLETQQAELAAQREEIEELRRMVAALAARQ